MPASRSTRPTPLVIAPRTPTAPQESLTPYSLTPRANSANIANPTIRGSASSTSSNSTIRPSTAPPGPTDLPTEHEALPSIPKADPDLTPKRSLTSRLTPLIHRQREMAQSQKTPTKSEKRTSSLQRWSSRISRSKEQKTSMPRYTLDPNQEPSPSPKSTAYNLPDVPPLPRGMAEKPRGPREQPGQVGGSRALNRQVHFNRRDDAVRITERGNGSRIPRESHQSPVLTRQTRRTSRALQPTESLSAHQPMQTSSRSSQPHSTIRNGDDRPSHEAQSVQAGSHQRNRSESSGSEKVWDDIEELTNLLIERQIQDQERVHLQEQAQPHQRSRHPIATTHMQNQLESGADGRRDIQRSRPVRRMLWPLLSRSRSDGRTKEGD